MLAAMAKPVIVETGAEPRAAVIWLHGLGASGHDFEPVVPELGLPAGLAVRFVFPHAPNIPVTINGGMVMPAWYDILELSITRRVDLERLRQSAEMTHGLIRDQEQQGIPADRVVLAGFSQGGAVAYEAALTYPESLAGLLALSTYFASAETIEPAAANESIPIVVYHGVRDPVVPEPAGHQAVEILRAMGRSPRYETYPMEHMVCLEQIQDIGRQLADWLQ